MCDTSQLKARTSSEKFTNERKITIMESIQNLLASYNLNLLLVLEVSATVFGLIQGILIWLNKRENWVFYLLNISTLIAFSMLNKLYGDVFENLLYLGIGIIGTVVWYSKTKADKNKEIVYCSNKERIQYSLILAGVSIACYIWLIFTDDPMPLLDALTTGMGITATIMMALKKVEAWVVWLIDDILMAVIYLSLPNQAVYLGVLNIVWIGLAVLSYINWSKIAKNTSEGRNYVTE